MFPGNRHIRKNLQDTPHIKTTMRGRSRSFSHALTAGVALLLIATCAQAASAPIPHGTLELVAENQWIAARRTFWLGLRFQLEQGWHIYWVNPGDSGEPPRVQWQLPTGLTVGAIEWPTPRRLGTSSIVDFGYEDAVMLIVPVHADASLVGEQPIRLDAEVKLLICSREMCIPGKTQLSITLPVKSLPPTRDPHSTDLFAATRRSLPRPAPGNWKLSVADTRDSFVLTANLGHQVTQAIFFPLTESQIENSAPQKLSPVAAGFRLTLRKSDRLLKPIDQLKGVLVLSDDHAYLIDVPASRSGAAGSSSSSGIDSVQSSKEGP